MAERNGIARRACHAPQRGLFWPLWSVVVQDDMQWRSMARIGGLSCLPHPKCMHMLTTSETETGCIDLPPAERHSPEHGHMSMHLRQLRGYLNAL